MLPRTFAFVSLLVVIICDNMTAQTRTMSVHAQEEDLGNLDGRGEVFGDLHLLDKVFKALLNTNLYREENW